MRRRSPAASRRLGPLGGVVCALLLVLAACGGEPENPVLATVDGAEIRADDFSRSYVDYLVTTGQNDTEANRRRHFEALVDAYLLGAEAERQGLAADSAVQADARIAERRLVGARYYEAAVLDTMAAPTQEEVERAFMLGREQRVVRQLYYTDEAEARAAFARLQAGASFLGEAQALYATDDSLAGSLGAVSYWQLDDAFAEASFSTPVGGITEPVRSRLGWHIVRVDDRIRNPLMTESEFERRRKGVESQIRLRRRRLEGDTFIRSFMEAREVAVNRPALEALVAAIRDASAEVAPDARQGAPNAFTPTETAALLEALTPQTPLATFQIRGQRQTLTVADYVAWLDVLPSAEARERTGASLGRALRNEALAQAGEARGIADEPEVRQELARMQRLRLADALRVRLRADAPAAADSARLGPVAGALRLSPQQTVADFWAVPFADRAAAEAAVATFAEDPAQAASQPGYQIYEGTPLGDVPALAAAVRAAPIGQPVLASVGDGWAVVRVAARRAEASGSGADVLAPFVPEADLLRRLRAERPLVIHEDALARVIRPPSVPQARR